MRLRALLPALVLLAACPTGRPPPPPEAPRSPTSREVQVESTPAGALVSAPGGAACATPCSLGLEPGRHHLSVRKTGHLPYEVDVEVGGAGPTRVSAALVSSH